MNPKKFELEKHKSFTMSTIKQTRNSLTKQELDLIIKIAKKRLLDLEKSYKSLENKKWDNPVNLATYLNDLGNWNGIRWIIEMLLAPQDFTWFKEKKK